MMGWRAHRVAVCAEGSCVALLQDLCRTAAGRGIQRVKREGWKDILVVVEAVELDLIKACGRRRDHQVEGLLFFFYDLPRVRLARRSRPPWSESSTCNTDLGNTGMYGIWIQVSISLELAK